MFVFVFDGVLFRLALKGPAFRSLFQFPPTIAWGAVYTPKNVRERRLSLPHSILIYISFARRPKVLQTSPLRGYAAASGLQERAAPTSALALDGVGYRPAEKGPAVRALPQYPPTSAYLVPEL